NFGGRFVVLVSDAGAIHGDDKLSTTHLNGSQVQLELAEHGIALYALHLKTPEGKKDYLSAEKDDKEVAFNKVANKPLYYPVEAGSVEGFGKIVDQLAGQIVEQVQGAAKGQLVPGSARSAQSGTPS